MALLLEELEGSPKPEEERFMRLACCVMDANAFRMSLPDTTLAEVTRSAPLLSCYIYFTTCSCFFSIFSC